jgi:hypothetical protein
MLVKQSLRFALVVALLCFAACDPTPTAEAPSPAGETPAEETPAAETGITGESEAEKEVTEEEEEEPVGVIHLEGTITVDPSPYVEGSDLNTRSEGEGTIELFIDVAEGNVTGKTTGWVKTYILCYENSGYYGSSEAKTGCCKDDVEYSVDEWMPMPKWDYNLNAEWDGWTVDPGTYGVPADIDYYGFYARPGGKDYEETGEKYGCWRVGNLHGWFVLDTEAEGYFEYPSFSHWEGQVLTGTPGCTWTATARAE